MKAWAAGAVAATERLPGAPAAARWGPLVALALSLPGLATAQAEIAPVEGYVGLKWLDYRDAQPGLDRIRVQSPSAVLRTPAVGGVSAEAQATVDRVSGASPRYHSAISGASRMSDERRAGDVKVTRHQEGRSWTMGLASSSENDFQSRAASVRVAGWTPDQNTGWSLTLGLTRDRIGSSDDPNLRERRRTVEAAAQFIQAVSRQDLVSATLTHAQGQGFYGDPYKRPDIRPGSRHQSALGARWNHHFEGPDITLRTAYRFYRDSFGVRSHTLEVEPVFTPAPGWSIAPSVRHYSQRAASFYFDPVYSYLGAPYPPGFLDSGGTPLSADHRLSGFGAWTLGLKLGWSPAPGWSLDLKLEQYEQRAGWRLGGPGSPGLAPLRARFLQWGLARRF